MPRREGELIGHTRCPACDTSGAEVRRDRSRNPYVKCLRCSPAKVFPTHGAPVKVQRLLARTRLVRGGLARSLYQAQAAP